MLKFNVERNLKGIPIRVDKMTKEGQYAFVNQVHADMDPYVPMLSGDLRTQSTIGIDGKSIHYNVPYAKKRFYEPASSYTTGGTTFRWDLKARAIHMASWVNVTKKAMK